MIFGSAEMSCQWKRGGIWRLKARCLLHALAEGRALRTALARGMVANGQPALPPCQLGMPLTAAPCARLAQPNPIMEGKPSHPPAPSCKQANLMNGGEPPRPTHPDAEGGAQLKGLGGVEDGGGLDVVGGHHALALEVGGDAMGVEGRVRRLQVLGTVLACSAAGAGRARA